MTDENGKFIKGMWVENSNQTELNDFGVNVEKIENYVGNYKVSNPTQENNYEITNTGDNSFNKTIVNKVKSDIDTITTKLVDNSSIKKTIITKNKIVDIYNNDIQITRDYPRDEVEEFYQIQLKNFDITNRIQLYDGVPVPDDLILEVDGSGRIIPRTQTTLERWLGKIKFW